MKTKLMIGTVIAVVLLTLTGCGSFSNKIPDLTDDQKDMIVEYATESLLHYDHKNGDKIKPSDKYEIVDETGDVLDNEAALEMLESGDKGTLVMPEEEYFEFEAPVTDNTEGEETEYSNASISDVIGLDGVSLNYLGYEVMDDYRENPDDYFVLNATEGNELIIIKYQLVNETADDRIISMPFGDVRYKISLNGNTKNALTTLLLNDMAFFSDMVLSGTGKELIVVGEFPKSELEAVTSLELIAKKGDENISFSLQ